MKRILIDFATLIITLIAATVVSICTVNQLDKNNQTQDTAQTLEQTTEMAYYTDAETGVCYLVLTDRANHNSVKGITPRYNADGTIMVREVQ